MERKEHVNNLAYEGHEVFSSEVEIKNYRRAKIDEVQSKVNRIKALFDRKINVLDVGSGNSKFLYALDQVDILNEGVGVELSKSRHEFANKWKDDLGIDNVTNINKDIFNCDLKSLPRFDLIFCADLVFQFFEPTKEDNGVKFLNNVYDKMNEGAVVILELDDHNEIIECMHNNEAKIWKKLEEPDPWRYLLWDCKYENSSIVMNKTFINRTTPEVSKSSVVLRNYTRSESVDLLRSVGFVDVELFEYYDKPLDLSEDEFITIGKKAIKTAAGEEKC